MFTATSTDEHCVVTQQSNNPIILHVLQAVLGDSKAVLKPYGYGPV